MDYKINNNIADRFSGMERLIGKEALGKLAHAHVLVVGLGGVGSWAVESLARSGIGKLTLVDLDDICVTNINRQLHALSSTIGKSKAIALQERVRDIHPSCEVEIIEDFFTADSAEKIFTAPYNLVVDAIDSLSAKALLIKICRDKEIPVIVTGGAGGKTDPTQICITDLGQTINDPLLQHLRKYLRQKFAFPRGKKSHFGISTVYSAELPHLPEACDVAGKLDCSTGYGTASYITATFGFLTAYKAIDILIKQES